MTTLKIVVVFFFIRCSYMSIAHFSACIRTNINYLFFPFCTSDAVVHWGVYIYPVSLCCFIYISMGIHVRLPNNDSRSLSLDFMCLDMGIMSQNQDPTTPETKPWAFYDFSEKRPWQGFKAWLGICSTSKCNAVISPAPNFTIQSYVTWESFPRSGSLHTAFCSRNLSNTDTTRNSNKPSLLPHAKDLLTNYILTITPKFPPPFRSSPEPANLGLHCMLITSTPARDLHSFPSSRAVAEIPF